MSKEFDHKLYLAILQTMGGKPDYIDEAVEKIKRVYEDAGYVRPATDEEKDKRASGISNEG
jgi:hypothetical protein